MKTVSARQARTARHDHATLWLEHSAQVNHAEPVAVCLAAAEADLWVEHGASPADDGIVTARMYEMLADGRLCPFPGLIEWHSGPAPTVRLYIDLAA